MAADAKIAALFDLPRVSPTLCDKESCIFFVGYLSEFYEHVVKNKSRHPWINEAELDALDSSLKTLREATPERVDWMPDYGCAVLKTEAGLPPGEVALNVVALHLHRFETASKLSSNGYSYVDGAVSSDYEVLPIGICPLSKLQELQGQFKRLLASWRSKNRKSGKTPAIVHALYRGAFGSDSTPRGGFGNFAEVNTAWPLVCLTLHQVFIDQEEKGVPISSALLLRKAIVHFGLYVSELTIDQFKKDEGKKSLDDGDASSVSTAHFSADDESGDGDSDLSSSDDEESDQEKPKPPEVGLLLDAFRILRSTSIKAAALSDEGLDMSHFLQHSKSIRCKILKEVSLRHTNHARWYKLPKTGGDFENFCFELPAPYSSAKDSAQNASEIRRNILRNSGWLSVIQGKCLDNVDKGVKKLMPSTGQDALSSMLVLKSVESIMWDYIKRIPVMSQAELEKLASLVDNYREVLHSFTVSGKYKPLSLVELKSREFLVVWVAFCIIHSNAMRLHEVEMEGFGVPLDFKDLSHLVLSDRIEWEAALRITKYLDDHGTNKPVFSLKDEKWTFDMGRRIANASSDMVEVWEQELKDASGRVEGHWKEVSRKQELARKLRAEIADLEVQKAEANRKLAPKQRELAEHDSKLRMRNSPFASTSTINAYKRLAHNACRRIVNELSSTVESLEYQLSSKHNSLKSALQAPPPVFQPLPQERKNAMPVIFFLYMPPVFRLLSRFSFTAQQQRLPQPWTGAWSGNEGSQKIDITSQVTRGAEYCQFSWKDYYNSKQYSQYHQPSASRSGKDYHVLLYSVSNDVPKWVGSKSVDHMLSKSDGIWYPDPLKPRMAWFGGIKNFDRASSGREINPFAELDHYCVVSAFTERLTKHSDLQWALMQPGNEYILPTRGNLPYARQNTKPNSLSKTQYLAFGNMRAYPNIQLRNVLVAIQERQLPFTEDMVHLLIYQALFHLGKISITGHGPRFEWKCDLEDPDFNRDAHVILQSFYEELKDSPKSYKSVKLLGKILNFFSEWEPKCRSTASELAKSVSQWAEELGGEVEKSPPSSAPLIRAKQVVLYQNAIMVLSGGSLVGADVALLVKLIVQSKNFFTGDNRSNEIRANATEIKYFLSQKVEDIIKAACIAPGMMTEALRSVYHRCPSSLRWGHWAPDGNYPTQCFEARKDGSTYTINLVTGEVLINGLPPSRLPMSVLSHPLYKRSFGDRNFEVVLKDDFLETRYPVFGRFYRFSKGSLKIYEFKGDESEMLELLDGTPDGVGWARELPIRLKSMHSHWLSREKRCIVLRGISFKDRGISFLIGLQKEVGKCSEGMVRCVESYCDERQNFLRLVRSMGNLDTLVFQRQSKALGILDKFEPKKYIHTILNGKNELSFFCPRYKLSFELRQGVFHCREIAGYQLMRKQQTGRVFRGMGMYLLLQEIGGNGRLIIFPRGKVVRKLPGQVHIEVKDGCAEQLIWYQYKFHPRFAYIETKQSRAARMQLAALHIATTTVLPDPLLGMTGEERAIELIRQCWGNRPLGKDESAALGNVRQLAHGLSPALSLLSQDIEKSSRQLAFLYSAIDDRNHVNTKCHEGLAYLNNVKTSRVSSRCYLTPREESQVIGIRAQRPTLPPRFDPNQTLLQSPVTDHDISSIQRRLDKYRSKSTCGSKLPQATNKPFPIDIKPSSKLELDMMNELKASWDAHISSVRNDAVKSGLDLKAPRRIQNDALQLRQKVETFILDALNKVSKQESHWHDSAHGILRVAELIPTATTADLAKIVIEPTLIWYLNPMLTHKSREILLESILIWLRLCVYEDKLARILTLSDSNSNQDIIKELDTVTIWDTSKHPYWLVFEVENGIQIRQEQYKVAQHLIDNRGDVIQLNMGLGKTRVILPMLILHYSFGKRNTKGICVRDKVTRLNFLSALLEEAYKYLQDNLCASILRIKIYQMPFCRDFRLDLASIAKMENSINDCRLDGGALVVAPEHRLSLELKAKELHRCKEKDIASCIDEEIIKQDIWRDILDECDELLRHRYQLIYAIGAAVALPGGANRWRAIQALFAALTQNDELKKYLSLHPKACNFSFKSNAEWPAIQFFDGESLNSMLGEHSERRSPRLQEGLLSKLCHEIFSNPPYELKWVLGHPLKEDIKKTIVEKDYSPTLQSLPEHHLSDILALRGFLAGGVLRHCLLKRHRVDFGVARPGKKRLAVPFRFADTPDERSEFAHPDCAIAFTILAYYYDGLSKNEFEQALRSLMTLGKNAQRNFYRRWFVASSHQMKTEDPGSFDSLNCVEKIDMTNEAQMQRMWHFYHRNMFTINFYLNNCVLPCETDQFDSRLTATSWNLAQNPSNNIVGFSGTNDNYRILPLQVRQYFATRDEEEQDDILKGLDGTNGKMLEMLINHTVGVRQLGPEAQRFMSLTSIISEGIKGSMQLMHAIIDCGALLAGTDLHEVSLRILSMLPVKEFGGVLFYDAVHHRDWVILERSGRLLPKDISPITEKDAFAIFDEPRCRGTDLKLRPEAIAMLTLAPKLCKDKLMQAAGRLRKLGRNQKLLMVGGSDVFSKINDLAVSYKKSSTMSSILSWANKRGFDATATQVLSWAMNNTCESTAVGLPNWSNQGLFFASTFDKNPLLSITEEILKLEDMYGKPFTEQTVVKTTRNAHLYHMNRTGGEESLHSSVKKMVDSIQNRVNEYGTDFTFPASGCDEECERELELEIEEEEEIEVELPLMEPVPEKKWDFKKALQCQGPSDLPTGIHPLSEFIRKFTKPLTLAKIKWSKKVYCTDNFARTVISQTDGTTSALNRFLRVVNFVLCFPDGRFLLLSEFEANALVDVFWKNSAGSHYLVHSSFLRKSLDNMNEILLQCVVQKQTTLLNSLFTGRIGASNVIENDSMASLQLFAGESTYATKERKEALKSMLRVRQIKFCPRTEVERIIEMRSLEKFYPYSDLEALCEEMLCEL